MDFKEIVNKLIKLNKTISTMESCTGGAVVNSITNIEGAGEVIKFSAITYCNEFKIKMGVKEEVIDKYTVYSLETAKEYINMGFSLGVGGVLTFKNEKKLKEIVKELDLKYFLNHS